MRAVFMFYENEKLAFLDMKNDTLNVTMTYIQFQTCELPPTSTGNVAASTIIAVLEVRFGLRRRFTNLEV